MRRLLFLFLPFIQVVEDTEVFFYQVQHILKVKAQKLEQLPAVIMAPEGCAGCRTEGSCDLYKEGHGLHSFSSS